MAALVAFNIDTGTFYKCRLSRDGTPVDKRSYSAVVREKKEDRRISQTLKLSSKDLLNIKTHSKHLPDCKIYCAGEDRYLINLRSNEELLVSQILMVYQNKITIVDNTKYNLILDQHPLRPDLFVMARYFSYGSEVKSVTFTEDGELITLDTAIFEDDRVTMAPFDARHTGLVIDLDHFPEYSPTVFLAPSYADRRNHILVASPYGWYYYNFHYNVGTKIRQYIYFARLGHDTVENVLIPNFHSVPKRNISVLADNSPYFGPLGYLVQVRSQGENYLRVGASGILETREQRVEPKLDLYNWRGEKAANFPSEIVSAHLFTVDDRAVLFGSRSWLEGPLIDVIGQNLTTYVMAYHLPDLF